MQQAPQLSFGGAASYADLKRAASPLLQASAPEHQQRERQERPKPLQMQAEWRSQLGFSYDDVQRAQQLARRDVALGLRYGAPPWAEPKSVDATSRPRQREQRRRRECRRDTVAYSRGRVQQREKVKVMVSQKPRKKPPRRRAVVVEAISNAAHRIQHVQQTPDDELDRVPSRDGGDAATGGGDVGKHVMRQQVQTLLNDVRDELRRESKALLEREVTRQAQLDIGEARAAAARRQSEKALRDVVDAGKAELQRHVEESTQRPEALLREAEAEAKRFRQNLMPLLAEAETRISRLQEAPRLIPSRSGLLGRLSRASAKLVNDNVAELVAFVLERLVDDTVRVLNQLEVQKGRDRLTHKRRKELREAALLVDRIDSSRAQIASDLLPNRRKPAPLEDPADTPLVGLERPANLLVHLASGDAVDACSDRDRDRDRSVSRRCGAVRYEAEQQLKRLAQAFPPVYDEAQQPPNGSETTARQAEIWKCRNQFLNYVHESDGGLEKQAGLQPVQLVQVIASEVVEDAIGSVASEMSTMCDDMITGMFENEMAPM